MSADSFHKLVEKAMKKKGKVYDFTDFVSCVGAYGDYVIMDHSDFYLWKSGLSESKASKSSRPLLRVVFVIEFRCESYNMFFKLRHNHPNFKEGDFRQKKGKERIHTLPEKQSTNRGIMSKKRNTIISELGSPIPSSRISFFQNLTVDRSTVGLLTAQEEYLLAMINDINVHDFFIRNFFDGLEFQIFAYLCRFVKSYINPILKYLKIILFWSETVRDRWLKFTQIYFALNSILKIWSHDPIMMSSITWLNFWKLENPFLSICIRRLKEIFNEPKTNLIPHSVQKVQQF